MINSAPTNINPWLSGGADASTKLIAGGIMLGQMLIPNPAKPKKIKASAPKKEGNALVFSLSAKLTKYCTTLKEERVKRRKG